jgi:hypothetical protein
MKDTFEINSVTGSNRIEVTAINRDVMAVTLTGANLSASAEVAHLGGGDGLDEYWANLAKNWRGWSDENIWRSLEGDLVLSASSDKRGHVWLTVTLSNGTPLTWQAEAILAIEAGQLERIASLALAFARYLGKPT